MSTPMTETVNEATVLDGLTDDLKARKSECERIARSRMREGGWPPEAIELYTKSAHGYELALSGIATAREKL